jgi:hypothetical protein
MGAHEVNAVALFDGPQPERRREMGLADAGRNSHILRSFSAPSPFTIPGIPSLAKRRRSSAKHASPEAAPSPARFLMARGHFFQSG